MQNEFLQDLERRQVRVNVFLVSGVKLVGTVHAFDDYVIRLDNQMVYKHGIATIIPAAEARPPRQVPV